MEDDSNNNNNNNDVEYGDFSYLLDEEAGEKEQQQEEAIRGDRKRRKLVVDDEEEEKDVPEQSNDDNDATRADPERAMEENITEDGTPAVEEEGSYRGGGAEEEVEEAERNAAPASSPTPTAEPSKLETINELLKIFDSDDEDEGDEFAGFEAVATKKEKEKKKLTNTVDIAMERIKMRNKKRKGEVEDEDKSKVLGDELIKKMIEASKEDAKSLLQNKPAVSKMKLLREVQSYFLRNDVVLTRSFMEVFAYWLYPSKYNRQINKIMDLDQEEISLGKKEKVILPSLDIRTILLKILTNCILDDMDVAESLNQTGLGRTIKTLSEHPSETSQNRLVAKKLMFKWAREYLGLKRRADEEEYDDDEYEVVEEASKTTKVNDKPKLSLGNAPETQEPTPENSRIKKRLRQPEPVLMDFKIVPKSKGIHLGDDELKKSGVKRPEIVQKILRQSGKRR